ncbi:Ferritin-like catalase Nec2, partial [Sarracenia purpurea var. burkii]
YIHIVAQLLAGLLGVESGQDAVIRTYLFERAEEEVAPYNITVAEFTTRISELRNRLAGCDIKDKGIIVPPQLGAENRTETNVLSANSYSVSYSRTPAEILRVVYGTGNEHTPGGFYPQGGNGKIAKGYLNKSHY